MIESVMESGSPVVGSGQGREGSFDRQQCFGVSQDVEMCCAGDEGDVEVWQAAR